MICKIMQEAITNGHSVKRGPSGSPPPHGHPQRESSESSLVGTHYKYQKLNKVYHANII